MISNDFSNIVGGFVVRGPFSWFLDNCMCCRVLIRCSVIYWRS